VFSNVAVSITFKYELHVILLLKTLVPVTYKLFTILILFWNVLTPLIFKLYIETTPLKNELPLIIKFPLIDVNINLSFIFKSPYTNKPFTGPVLLLAYGVPITTLPATSKLFFGLIVLIPTNPSTNKPLYGL